MKDTLSIEPWLVDKKDERFWSATYCQCENDAKLVADRYRLAAASTGRRVRTYRRDIRAGGFTFPVFVVVVTYSLKSGKFGKVTS